MRPTVYIDRDKHHQLSGRSSKSGISLPLHTSRSLTPEELLGVQKMDNDRSPVEVWHDPIVAEVRQVREALFAEANYDIHEFCVASQPGKKAPAILL